jgi:hypothetical protein
LHEALNAKPSRCSAKCLETIHQIGARAERKVERELLDDLKRVAGKQNLLFELADATLAQPDAV